jgi:shikimate dehydrogenase
MHNAALAEASLRQPRLSSWRYFAFDVEPGSLGTALDALAAKGFVGVNLTVPHKVLAVGLVRSLDAGARDAGAVNTLLRDGSGWKGFNTDGYGLAESLREDLGVSLAGLEIVILGAGGAARGAAVECLRQRCAGLWLANRSKSNLASLQRLLSPLAGKIPVRSLGDDPAPRKGALVINATSAGLLPDDPAPADLAAIPAAAVVYDMIYNPPRTKLLGQAAALGLRSANGLGMLVHQGAKALEIWTGIPAGQTAPAMRAAASKALGYG